MLISQETLQRVLLSNSMGKGIALVLEGGAMQGMYTAGVLDVFMDKDIHFDAIIGVSAGAIFGVNYLSKQRGRVIRYNKKFNCTKGYMGIGPLLKEGNIINTEYAYDRVPHKLDVFDDETYKSSPIPFIAVLTNIKTGKPEYFEIKSVFDQMDYLRASASMPFVSKPVNLNGNLYLDGAVTDSIPFQHMLDLGYDKLVVILTKSVEYVKKPLPKGLAKLLYHKNYPEFEKRVVNRHNMYNEQKRRIHELERKGTAKVLRPSKPLYLKKIEKDPEKLEELYQLGIKDALTFLNENSVGS